MFNRFRGKEGAGDDGSEKETDAVAQPQPVAKGAKEMSEDDAATKIQATFRGHRVREKSRLDQLKFVATTSLEASSAVVASGKDKFDASVKPELMKQSDALENLVLNYVPPEVQAEISARFEAIKLEYEEKRLILEKEIAVQREKLEKIAAEKKAEFEALLQKKKEEFEEKLAQKIEEKLWEAMDKTKEVVKANVKDPDMPKFVASGIDRVVDEVWPDIAEEVIDMLMARMRKQVEIDQGQEVTWCPNPWKKLRALVLYTLRPHDQSIWRQLKNPFFWLLTLTSLFPLYGVPQIYYLVILFMIDKTDEYQLCQFILGFKGIQFVTGGIIPAIIGGVLYSVCVFYTEDDGTNSCPDDGPKDQLWQVTFFVLQVFMVWTAFLMLPYTKKKGGRRFKAQGNAAEFDIDNDGVLDENEMTRMKNIRFGDGDKTTRDCFGFERHPDRGGKLFEMVIYDTLAFFICCVLMAVALFANSDTDIVEKGVDPERNWRLGLTIFWCKCLYGLLSFPFVIFKLPLLGMWLTHARPTAYNRNGVTVPPDLKKTPAPQKSNKVTPVDVDTPTDENV